MRIKLVFSGSNNNFDCSPQDIVNSCVHRMLGSDNEYHDKFSPYAVSGLYGGEIIDDKVSYQNGCYFYISSHDENFMNKIFSSIYGGIEMRDMKLIKVELEGFIINDCYDIIKTISPILLFKKDKLLTFKDEEFIEVLTQKSRRKLLHDGFSENDVNTLVIEPFHFENAKLKFPKVHNIINIASQVMLIVRGNKKVRNALYELGLGKSTGCGFGSIEIMNFNKN